MACSSADEPDGVTRQLGGTLTAASELSYYKLNTLGTLRACDEALAAIDPGWDTGHRLLLMRKRNAFAPINTLSLELILDIFDLLLEHELWFSSSYYPPVVLSLVCHYWNQILNTTPSLWANIMKNDLRPMISVTRHLERSRHAPLRITFSDWDAGDTEEFVAAILPHAARWKELSMRVDIHDCLPQDLIGVSAPLLSDLDLTVVEEDSVQDEPFDIFPGEAPPSLKSITLERVALPWTPKLFRDLISLCIYDIEDFAPSLDQLAEILSACPSLQLLCIVRISIPPGTGKLLQNGIRLEALNGLELELEPEPTNALLAAIQAPNITTASFECELQVHPFQVLFTPQVSHFFSLLSTDDNQCSITWNKMAVWLRWTGRLAMFLHMDSSFQNFDLLIKTFGFLVSQVKAISPQNTVPLDLGLYHRSLEEIEAAFSLVADLQALNRLKLGLGTPITTIFSSLTTPKWSFLSLEEIIFDGSMEPCDWASLQMLLRSRNGKLDREEGDEQRPRPIRKVTFDDDAYSNRNRFLDDFKSVYWPGGINLVRSLLGPEGKLVWYGKGVTLDGVFEDPSEI